MSYLPYNKIWTVYICTSNLLVDDIDNFIKKSTILYLQYSYCCFKYTYKTKRCWKMCINCTVLINLQDIGSLKRTGYTYPINMSYENIF